MQNLVTRRSLTLLGALAAAALCVPTLANTPPAGSRAKLSTIFHNVSGTVEILNSSKITIRNFYFDGGGVDVRLVVAANDNDALFASSGRYVGPQLLGSVFNGESLDIDLLPGESLNDINAISVWCIPFQANFGSATFFCGSDFDQDGFVTGDDFDAYVDAFEIGDISADFIEDGFVTGDDFDAFVQAFERGC